MLVKNLNPRLRYYYFRFLKTNVPRVLILLPVPIFTRHHRHVILHLSTKFRPIGPSATEFWRYIRFQDGLPTLVSIGSGGVLWQGVEFQAFPLTFNVILTALWHYRASVWLHLRVTKAGNWRPQACKNAHNLDIYPDSDTEGWEGALTPRPLHWFHSFSDPALCACSLHWNLQCRFQ